MHSAASSKCFVSEECRGIMGRVRTLWLMFVTCVFLFQISTARHGAKPPSAMVVGTVFCDTCSQRRFTKTSYFLSGASILVECRDLQGNAGFKEEAKTNWLGEFEVLLPFQVRRKVQTIRQCSVQLANSSDTHCSTASSSTIHSLKLKSRKEGVHVFSAGFFTFKPIEVPRLCHQEPSPVTFSQVGPAKTWIPPILGSNLTIPDLPTIPRLQQIPEIPPLPTLNKITNPPNGAKPTVSSLDSSTSKMIISFNAPLPFFRLPPITIGFDPFLAPPPPILHSDPLQPPFYKFPPGGFSKLPPPSSSFYVPPSASPEDEEPIHPRNSPVPTSKKMSP